MRASLFSPSWYRVAALKPRLRSHAEIHRHEYRGEPWYVLQDHTSGRFMRFTPGAYLLIGLMDGDRTVQEIWETGGARLGDDAPTQEEMIRILSQLHAADVLVCDVPPDTLELLRRYEKKRGARWKQNIRNPLSVRFKLLDPERYLVRFARPAKLLFSWPGALVWLLAMGGAVSLLGLHWPELTENVTDRVLAPGNLVLIWLIFPVLKAFHEFGHAFAVKRLGGEVHEMGIIFLVFTPIPYVDASSASAFRSKWERAFVGAAGMALELFLAALAVFVWSAVEPGPLRAVTYNIILIAGVSSLLFNINPLLRYDGYYILADVLEIPNLGPRGLQYLGYLVQHYLFRVRDAEPPVSTPGERVWFVLYTASSFVYRIFIYAAIIVFIADKFFFVGVIIALWAVASMVVLPIFKASRFLVASPKLGRRRAAAIAASVAALLALAALVCFVPVPLSTRTEGVVWIPEDAFVRAGAEGVVERLAVPAGRQVNRGDLLVECSDPLLPARIRVLVSKQMELQALYDSQILTDRVAAQVTREQMKGVDDQLRDARERAAELTVRSPARGVFLVADPQDLPGRFVRRGDVLGYVVPPLAATVRVVVSQPDADLVRERTRAVQLRFPWNFSEIMPASLKREVPAATDRLPSKVLGQSGGGGVAIDPRDEGGTTSFQKVFLFDIEPAAPFLPRVGSRVYVRFDHGAEPLVGRWYRAVRHLLLKSFHA